LSDGRTDDIMMPRANHTCVQCDRLKRGIFTFITAVSKIVISVTSEPHPNPKRPQDHN